MLRAASSFGNSSFDVLLGCWVVCAAAQDDRVEGAVELPVAAAAEAVADGLSARGRQWGNAGEACEGGVGVDTAMVRLGDEQLRGDDHADARLVEQRGCEDADVLGELAFEIACFPRRCLRATGEQAKRKPCRRLFC